ncbi:hypothetical protein K438DRAFT_1765118 [Mycena galopus ATCC 62051]|nr:hypothetical protein K438DRAFT_1765118 [Mycena galopus ATCC 62051]
MTRRAGSLGEDEVVSKSVPVSEVVVFALKGSGVKGKSSSGEVGATAAAFCTRVRRECSTVSCLAARVEVTWHVGSGSLWSAPLSIVSGDMVKVGEGGVHVVCPPLVSGGRHYARLGAGYVGGTRLVTLSELRLPRHKGGLHTPATLSDFMHILPSLETTSRKGNFFPAVQLVLQTHPQIHNQIAAGINENTPLIFFPFGGLIEWIRKKDDQLQAMHLTKLNDTQLLAGKIAELDLHKQLMIVRGTPTFCCSAAWPYRLYSAGWLNYARLQLRHYLR